jgi:hypothetical protein
MSRPMKLMLAAGAVSVLAGCASSDHVLFVTKTSVGIDFDSKPLTASLAYDRIEGYVAPVYGNGEIPPVVASVKSDGTIFAPAVRQVYATGDAALIATGGKRSTRKQPMQGARANMMFFGTTTTTGIKLGFTTGLPDSFVFGYKRKEYSYIPLVTVGTGEDAHDVYPSVLASIDTAANVATDGTVDQTALTNAQFFATGDAARRLARHPTIRSGFQAIAERAVLKQQIGAVREEETLSNAIDAMVVNILDRYADQGTTADERSAIVAAARQAGLDPDSTMTTNNFRQQLPRASSTAQNRERVRAQLEELQERINTLLQD